MDELIKKESANLSTPPEELEYRLLTETDIDEMRNIISLFNLNIQKKNILRTGKLNDLQDKIYDQIRERVDKKPDEFSNKDLLDYFKVIQDTITKSDTTLDKVDTPNIQINQNQLNINVGDDDALSQESKRKVMEAVRKVLKQAQESELSAPLTNDTSFDIMDVDYNEISNNQEEDI